MAKKELDITKIGYQKYKQLQEANNEKFSDPTLDEFRSNFKPIMGNMNPYVNATKDINLPDMGNTPYGRSIYDKPNVNIEALKHLGDIRAEEQSALSKIGAGIAKGTILAGTTLLNGTVGLLAGLGEWAATGKVSKIWDNEISKGLDEFEKKSEEWLPNYYSEKELNTPWYENIFTANFWGDKFLKNLGFTIGAYYSGGLYTKGLGAILKGLKAGSTVSTITQSGIGSFISAVNEGSKEAINGADEYFNEHKPLLDQHYKEKLLAAKVAYEANKGKTLVYREGKLIDKAWTDYQDTLKKEDNNYKKALARLEEDRAKVGNTILALNIPVLTASNWYQFGKLYSKGFNTSARATINNIEGTVGKYSVRGSSKASKVAKILGGGIAEGNEEMAQRNISDTQKHYYATDFNNFYRSLHGLEAEEETLDWFKSAGLTITKNFTDNGANAAWEEFTIGALTGLLGMPSFRSIRNDETGKFQSPVTLEGNAISKWKELSENAERDKAMAKKLNDRVNSKEFKNYYLGQKRHQKYQDDMNDSAARNDEFDYKNAEHAQLLSDIEMFNNAGKLEDLKTAIGEAFDISDKNLNAIIESTTSVDADGNLVGPYAKYAKKNTDGSVVANLENKESKDEMIESLRSDKDRILDTVKNYETTREKLDRITNYRFTDENLNEITWLSTQLDNWEDRASGMMDKVQDSIGSILGAFDTHKRFYEAIINKEGTASAELTDEYKRADKTLRIINENIKVLESLRSADTQTIVRELIDHPGLIKNVLNVLDKIDPTVINAVEQNDLRTKLNDLLRLRDAYETFNHKFIEYINNPEKLDEDHKQVDEQIEEQRTAQDMIKKLEAINKATNYEELQSLIDSEEVTEDDINNGQSEIAKSFKKASLLMRKASEIIEEANMPSQQKSIFKQMLSSRFNKQSNYDDLVNTSLLPDLPLEAQILDDNIKESLIGMFGEIIKRANDKVNGGNRQKQNVDVKPNGTVKPPNTGKDDVMLPPQQSESLEDTMTKILESSKLPEPVKQSVVPLINKVITDLKTLQKTLDKSLIDKVTKLINEIKGFIGESKVQPLIDKLNSLSSLVPESDKLVISSPEDVLKDLEEEAKEYKSTAVTGVLKAVIPQFDLDAKRNGELIDFVGDGRNQGYSYVYSKLKEVDPKTGKNAFDYVNEGNVKEGDELEVRYEPATDEHPELLALYHNDVLINYMNTDEAIEGVKEIKDKAKKVAQSTSTIRITLPSYYSSMREQLGDKTRTWSSYADIQRTYSNITYVTGIFYQGALEPAINFAIDAGVLPRKYKKYLNKTRNGSIELEDLQEIIDEFKKLGIETPNQLISYVEAHSKNTSIGAEFDESYYKDSDNFSDKVDKKIANNFDALKILYEEYKSNKITKEEFLRRAGGVKSRIEAFFDRFYADKEAFLSKPADSAQTASSNNPTVRVSKIMNGQYGYNRAKPQSIGELLGIDDAIIGVMRNGDMYANTEDYIEPVFNEAESDGKVYIMLPNSKGTLAPKQVYIRYLNKAEFDLNTADNEIANEIREVFKKLANLSEAKDPETTLNDDIFPELASILYLPDSFHINVDTKNTDLILQIGYDKDGKRHNENITLIKNAVRSFSFGITSGESINDTPTPIDANEVYKQIIEAFYNANLAFNINSKELKGKDGQKYANKLRDSGVLFTYLTNKKMQGTWFLLGDAPRNDLSNTAFERQKAKDANKVGVKLEYNGNTYYVNLITGDIYNDTNAVVQLDKKETQLLNDLAYIQHTYGDTLYGINQINGRVLINNNGSKRGYDRNTNRYLSNEELAKLENEILALKDIQEEAATISSDLIADQELVKRKDDGSPDTTDEAYFIKEEDGQYYEYQRVHSIIDELYGKQYEGAYTGPKNNAAITQGTLVDDIARQFFINNRVKKPEGISREAFKNLTKSLEEFKNKLTREGFIIKTDRIVLFNKYSDDTRIAGELDMYAYNPTTGEVRIYDFKTSKYSTRDTKFSVTPNSNYSRSNKDQYTLQLSVYAKLFEDRYGKKVSKLTILPFWIHYNNAGINSLTSEQEVPLTYDEGVLQGLSSNTAKEPEVNKKSAARDAAHRLNSLKPKTPIEPKEDPNPPQTIVKPDINSDDNIGISEQDRSKATVENWDTLDKSIQQLFMKSIGTNDVEIAKQFWDSSDSTYREQMLNCG